MWGEQGLTLRTSPLAPGAAAQTRLKLDRFVTSGSQTRDEENNASNADLSLRKSSKLVLQVGTAV